MAVFSSDLFAISPFGALGGNTSSACGAGSWRQLARPDSRALTRCAGFVCHRERPGKGTQG